MMRATRMSSISRPTRRSILNLYKALIALRQKRPELVAGAYEPVAAQGDVLLYRRRGDEGAAVIVRSISAPSRLR